MPVTGDGGRKVLFVAEAPGRNEDEQGIQLIGKAGQYLRRVLLHLDFDLDEDAWKTNAIICRPPGNRSPTSAEISYCEPNLFLAIKEYRPNVIIPLGGAAISAVIGPLRPGDDIGQTGRWIGWNIPDQTLNVWICPTWHPSYLLRQSDSVLNRQFKEHLKTAIAHNERPWTEAPPDWKKDIKIVLDPEAAVKWIKKCAKMKTGAIAWDYETNCLKPDWQESKIASCSIAWGRYEPEKCIAFPWSKSVVPAMQKLLSSPVPKIASNLKFENRWTKKEFGHCVRTWVWDTMLAAHVCNNRSGITSVKFQAYVRLGAPLWNQKIDPFLKSSKNSHFNKVFEADIEDLLLYNGLDSILEFRVACDQIKELGEELPWYNG
jgi:uracil-DNA glycosylase family 4